MGNVRNAESTITLSPSVAKIFAVLTIFKQDLANYHTMPLKESTEEVNWPVSHFVYAGKTGPFGETARACWESFNANAAAVGEVAGGFVSHFSLYKIEPEMIYKAGKSVASPPTGALPAGIEYMEFAGGKYLQFTLTGCYSQLPVVVGQVFERVKNENVSTRRDFYIEHYANDPATTATEDLITHILIPIN